MKVKGKCEESTAKQSILDCILLQRKHLLHVCRRTENFTIMIGQETQNQTWLPYFNWNYVNIYLHYQHDISVIVAPMSLPWNFHSNKEQLGWLYSQAMVRFYAVGVRMKGTWWGIIFKILVGFWFWGGGHFQIRDCVTFGVILGNFTFWLWYVGAGIIFSCFWDQKRQMLASSGLKNMKK